MEWIGWECLANRWQSRQRTLWRYTSLLHSSGKNWYFLHDPFHRVWIKHSSKVNIKPTQWRKCHLCRLRCLDDFGWIDYASQKYRSHFALHPPELARDWWAAISQQVVSTYQRSELTLLPIKPLPFRSHATVAWGCGGGGIRERGRAAGEGEGLLEEAAMHHHGVLTLHTGKHLGFLCCVSQWEIMLFSLLVSFANTFFSILFPL